MNANAYKVWISGRKAYIEGQRRWKTGDRTYSEFAGFTIIYDSMKQIWRPTRWFDIVDTTPSTFVGEWPGMEAAKDAVLAHYANYDDVPGERLTARSGERGRAWRS